MIDPNELESRSKDPDPWTKEQQDQHRFDNFMEDIMSLLFAAAISGILIAVILN